jgi:hypothetical protein
MSPFSFSFSFLAVLEFELRALCLIGSVTQPSLKTEKSKRPEENLCLPVHAPPHG